MNGCAFKGCFSSLPTSSSSFSSLAPFPASPCTGLCAGSCHSPQEQQKEKEEEEEWHVSCVVSRSHSLTCSLTQALSRTHARGQANAFKACTCPHAGQSIESIESMHMPHRQP